MKKNMKNDLPVVGITMGDPVGIGPEILIKAMLEPQIHEICRPVVFGDRGILEQMSGMMDRKVTINPVRSIEACQFQTGSMDVFCVSCLAAQDVTPGSPTIKTGKAMLDYILNGVELAVNHEIHALVTCPITKTAMKMAQSPFHGHTELIAHKTGTDEYAMMLAGSRLKVVLVTIHIPLSKVSGQLSINDVLKTIRITDRALKERFGIRAPRIAVAGLNPHAGEEGMFGNEENEIIRPAVAASRREGIDTSGPLPPDTVFLAASNQTYDAVICMYHDQGLIPFKMIHFKDGVNTTIGLPIIRTSVDHGTAYDIAYKGIADHSSLVAAIKMAAFQAGNKEKIQ